MKRRAFLTAWGAGIGCLAGCNRLSGVGANEERRVDTRSLAAEFEPVAPPETPFDTATITERVRVHEQRATELLADVPADPSIPNETVRERLDAERPETTPAASLPADKSAMRWLDEWRGHRSSAATVRGSYRAATGTDGLEPYVQQRRDAFGFELTGSDSWLFREGVNSLEHHRRDAREARDDGRYATAVLEAGQALVSAELLSTVVTGIRDGRYPDEPSADDIREAAAAARAALTDGESTADAGLAEGLRRPAVFRQRGVIEEMADGYRGGPEAYAEFTHAAMHARGVPGATEFIAAQMTKRDD